MARNPRIGLPRIAQHIVQRGNDRQACFADDADDLHYRQELGKAVIKHDCALHACVLMTNHVRFRSGIEALICRSVEARTRGRPASAAGKCT